MIILHMALDENNVFSNSILATCSKCFLEMFIGDTSLKVMGQVIVTKPCVYMGPCMHSVVLVVGYSSTSVSGCVLVLTIPYRVGFLL